MLRLRISTKRWMKITDIPDHYTREGCFTKQPSFFPYGDGSAGPTFLFAFYSCYGNSMIIYEEPTLYLYDFQLKNMICRRGTQEEKSLV